MLMCPSNYTQELFGQLDMPFIKDGDKNWYHSVDYPTWKWTEDIGKQ